ncbi:MAG: hypothetical protein GXP01_00820, partial [Alphaproteobacteria bacterium]|nr:hypothetical protein [Alphaproteobacteria bacterium]
PDPIDLTTPPLAGLNTRIDTLERELLAQQDRFADASELSDLEARMAALAQSVGTDDIARADLSELAARVDTLASQPPAGFNDLTARLARLESEQNAPPPAAAPTGAPAGADRARLDRLFADIAALSDRVSQIAGTSESTNAETISQIATLETKLTALAARLAVLDEPARLARIEAGRQAGFDAIMRLEEKMLGGGAFADELKSVTSRLPALPVPEELVARATSGLATVNGLSATLVERMPDILRALASEKTDASLLERLGDQLAAMVALRPDGTPEGDTAIAGLARLETALERGEVIAANTGFLALPEAARAAAGDFGAQLSEAAAAAEWIGLARAALTTADGAAS